MPTLEGVGPTSYGFVPAWVARIPGYKHPFEAVLRSLACFAGAGYQCAPRRSDVMALARVGLTTYTRAIRWLVAAGLIETIERQPGDRGARRRLLWKRSKNGLVPVPPSVGATNDGSKARASLRALNSTEVDEKARASWRAPQSASLRAPSGAPRLKDRARVPEEPEENSVPLPYPPDPAAEPATVAGTGRDDFRSDLGPEPSPASGDRPPLDSAAVAALEARIADLSRDPRHRLERLKAVLELRELVEGPREYRPPAAARPVPAATPAARDPNVSLTSVLEAARSLMAPSPAVGTAETLARSLAARWRDAKPLTLATFTAAASRIPPAVLTDMIRDADRTEIKKPAHRFARLVGEWMRSAGRDTVPAGRRLEPPPGRDDRGSIASVPLYIMGRTP